MQATKHHGDLKNKALTPAFHELKTVADALLSPVMDYSAIWEAVAFDDTDSSGYENIKILAGFAIGPMPATFCIIDMMRTRKFILGIRDAIDERLKMNPGQPVTVLYAGTRPFAYFF